MDVLGRALMATQQYDSAETFFLKALNAAPQAAAPAYHLGVLYLRTNQPALAEKYLHMARTFDPNGPSGAQAAELLARYFP
jgi:Flp pilus assembly protein TadD